MYQRILVPVDLTHLDQLAKALQSAADLARLYRLPVCYVGVTAETPTPVAHNPKEYAAKLAAFGEEQARAHGIEVTTKAYARSDPAAQINETLLQAISENQADLVVMASHAPNVVDYILPSHGGSVAKHAAASVFLVR
jgi:nucleotide-binding universal stress UspA family protein